MEQILPSTSTIPDYSTKILIDLPLPALVNLCKTSKEFEELICQESFWEKKVKHDHPFLQNQTNPPKGFTTWREYLIHRHMLRKNIKDLIYRWLNLPAIKMGDLEEGTDEDEYHWHSPRLTFEVDEGESEGDNSLDLTRSDYLIEENPGIDNIDVAYQYPDYGHSESFRSEDIDQEMPKLLAFLDNADTRVITLLNRNKILVKLDYTSH